MRAIRALIFHGYLLRGTGSNVYNASLARALAHLGHEVHLVCQDREAASLEWVDAMGRWRGGSLEVEAAGGAGASGAGSVAAYVPEIGGLLPVYVKDRYEGFRVKTFLELDEAELARYLEANVAAVRDIASRAGGVDAALANHLVMGPAILARAGLGAQGTGPPGYAVKVHGSDLEFTVRRDPERFLPYAREGLSAAAGVLVGSRHTAEVLWETLEDPELAARTRLGPPGVDADLFRPRDASEAVAAVRELAAELPGPGGGAGGGFGRDTAAAVPALQAFAAAAGPRVVFVGKLIPTKGVDLLLAAWPAVLERHPGARLLIVAFGEQRGELERLAKSLAPPGTVHFTGRLEHEEVARILPAADAMVVPSTFPEAFGMVAAEAAAAGVLPVCADHSGLHEVAAALAAALPPEAARLVAFRLGEGAVGEIAEHLCAWLDLPPAVRERAREALAATARERWGWEGVARGVLAASAGRLGELPSVPDE